MFWDKVCVFVPNKACTREIIYDNYKLVFCHDKLQNFKIELWSNLFIIIYVKMVQWNFFMTIKSSFFVMISYQIVTLTYDQSYLQLKMLNNGTRESIYDN